jgi:hypothetical protein
MRRGFKSEAHAIAREVRAELGVGLAAPLDPWRLAKFLEIPLVPLSDFATDAPGATRMLLRQHRAAFSAVTVFYGCERVIVYNDGHSRARQASDIAHELAHALLHHPAKPAFDSDGQRNWDSDLEREAEWLGGALLISDEAAIAIVRRQLSDDAAAEEFCVSQSMLTFRLRVTGARVRVTRMARFRN